MNITLTKEEMDAFQSKLSEWYNERSIYAFDRTSVDVNMRSNVRGIFRDLFAQFEKEHPRPDWKSLL